MFGIFGRLASVPCVLKAVSQPLQGFRTLLTSCTVDVLDVKSKSLLFRVLPLQPLGAPPVRTAIRKYFRRPSEWKRVKRHGWIARMSTPSGRKIIMNRILKGRHVLTH